MRLVFPLIVIVVFSSASVLGRTKCYMSNLVHNQICNDISAEKRSIVRGEKCKNIGWKKIKKIKKLYKENAKVFVVGLLFSAISFSLFVFGAAVTQTVTIAVTLGVLGAIMCLMGKGDSWLSIIGALIGAVGAAGAYTRFLLLRDL